MSASLRLRPGDADREAGSIAPMVPILVLAFLILGGLVIDGGRDLNARAEAQAYAEEAARAGASAVDLTSDTLALDDAEARARVAAYCDAVRSANSAVTRCEIDPAAPFGDAITCGGRTSRIVVNTDVELRIGTTLLDIVGLAHLDTAGQGKARPYEGTSPANAC